MKKQLLIIGMIALLVCVGLSGCNQQTTTKSNYNIGDSIVVGNIRYTFLSADWADSSTYNLNIKGENLGTSVATGIIAIIKYEMRNGYSYTHNDMFGLNTVGTTFTINPGREQTQTISSYNEIDRGFLPVSKIYLNFRKLASDGYSYDFIKAIVLNV